MFFEVSCPFMIWNTFLLNRLHNSNSLTRSPVSSENFENCVWFEIDWNNDFQWIDSLNSSPLDKMAPISHTIYWDAFSWMKIIIFWFKIYRSWFLSVPPINSQQPSIGYDNGLAPNRRQAIIWNNADPIHWRIYAALRRDELTAIVMCPLLMIKVCRRWHGVTIYSPVKWRRVHPRRLHIGCQNCMTYWCKCHDKQEKFMLINFTHSYFEIQMYDMIYWNARPLVSRFVR